MQIDIDFEVYKALTALRGSESDSYNAVIRRLLGLPSAVDELNATALNALLGETASPASSATNQQPSGSPRKRGIFGSVYANAQLSEPNALIGLLGRYAGGLWLGNAHFPDGTKFRATYKGETYVAEVRDGKWLDQEGVQRTSPSEAASAITGNNVNGWRFWLVQLPDDPTWRKLDEFKS
jgi:hypothetical protein